MKELTETRQATIEQTQDNLLEVRYKPGETIDTEGLMDVIKERERICGGHCDQAVLAVIPPDADFQLALMTKDHYHGRPVVDCTKFLAVAASSAMHERMASLYFAYFPQPFATQVFQEEGEARAWLLARMREVQLS